MITVLLDSSDRNLAVGIAKDNKLIDYVQYEAWQRQSELMITELQKLLEKHHIVKEDIESVMCGIGPGSYTGVRISLTIAKVMAMALGIPLFTVSSLRILKDHDKPSICIINARSGRSYVGVYQKDEIIMADQIMKNEDLLKYIKNHQDFSLCGSLEYLHLEGKKANVLEEMFSLKNSLTSEKDPLGLTPVYMKD